jgi:hypothetical protein
MMGMSERGWDRGSSWSECTSWVRSMWVERQMPNAPYKTSWQLQDSCTSPVHILYVCTRWNLTRRIPNIHCSINPVHIASTHIESR